MGIKHPPPALLPLPTYNSNNTISSNIILQLEQMSQNVFLLGVEWVYPYSTYLVCTLWVYHLIMKDFDSILITNDLNLSKTPPMGLKSKTPTADVL